MQDQGATNLSLSSQTKGLLAKHNFIPKKKLGQNFIIDASYVERIVGAADLSEKDLVIVIGTGLGALTKELSLRARQVISIEYDKILYEIGREILKECGNVELIRDDFLKLALVKLLKGYKTYKVVANVPYYITAPIITKLIETKPGFSIAVLTVQREVGERLTAAPGSKEYGTLSIYVQYFNDVSIVSFIPRSAFLPHPAVSSAIVKMTPRKEPPVKVDNEELFFKVVHAAFEYRRKTLRNSLVMSTNLGISKDTIDSALKSSGIDGERRGETLSLEEFARLANSFYGS